DVATAAADDGIAGIAADHVSNAAVDGRITGTGENLVVRARADECAPVVIVDSIVITAADEGVTAAIGVKTAAHDRCKLRIALDNAAVAADNGGIPGIALDRVVETAGNDGMIRHRLDPVPGAAADDGCPALDCITAATGDDRFKNIISKDIVICAAADDGMIGTGSVDHVGRP